MALGDDLCQLASQRSKAVASPEPSHHAELIDELQTRASSLSAAVARAEDKLEDNQQQRRESQGFKGNPRPRPQSPGAHPHSHESFALPSQG